MNSRILYALSGITVVLIGATIYLTPAPISERVAPGEPMFANLDTTTINTAASLTITAKGKSFTVYQKDGNWVVKEMSDYPAETALIRKALARFEGNVSRAAEASRRRGITLDVAALHAEAISLDRAGGRRGGKHRGRATWRSPSAPARAARASLQLGHRPL